MKVVNICPQFSDGWTYQENYLPKYQKRLGNEVTIIAADFIFGKGNKMVKCDKTDYYTDYGVKIVRLKSKGNHSYEYKFRDFINLYEVLSQESPDVLFVHGVQFVYMSTILKFKKSHPQVRIFVDNHADFSNSATNWLSKNILHKIIWKHYAKKLNPYVEKWFGVLPARVDFLHNMYDIPREKIELLVMGADDDCLKMIEKNDLRHQYRKKYNIADDDFLIVTGGKIDLAKQQTLLLMEAVNQINSPHVKLIVFGSVVDPLKAQVASHCSDKVKYIGWVQGEDSYAHFAMADLAVFPGRHSVFWEQVAGMGIPMIVKYWEGTTHVDGGGNVRFIMEDSANEIYKLLNDTISRNSYPTMKARAASLSKEFLYSEIAKRSLNISPSESID